MQVELPRHMYVVALEEHLLLEAYRHLCSADMSLCCPPDITLASRNDLIALAAANLSENCLEVFLSYAETLCRSLSGPVMVDLPPPVGDFEARAPAAEQLAWHYLQEGRGSLWLGPGSDILVDLGRRWKKLRARPHADPWHVLQRWTEGAYTAH